MKFDIAVATSVGERRNQQDSVRVTDVNGHDYLAVAEAGTASLEDAAVVVADGMGGHAGGEIASQIVADTFAIYLRKDMAEDGPRKLFSTVLNKANEAITEQRKVDGNLDANSGSTVVAGWLSRNRLRFISVGDSLIYRFRDNELHCINKTDNQGDLLDTNAILAGTNEAWDIANGSSRRAALCNAVSGDVQSPAFQFDERDVLPGDILLFASDGIETFSVETLRRAVPALLENSGSVAGIAKGLISGIEGCNKPKQDNTSVIVVGCGLKQVDTTEPLPEQKKTRSAAAASSDDSLSAPHQQTMAEPPASLAPENGKFRLFDRPLIAGAMAAAILAIGAGLYWSTGTDSVDLAKKSPDGTVPSVGQTVVYSCVSDSQATGYRVEFSSASTQSVRVTSPSSDIFDMQSTSGKATVYSSGPNQAVDLSEGRFSVISDDQANLQIRYSDGRRPVLTTCYLET